MKNIFENVTGGHTPQRELLLKAAMEHYSLPLEAFEVAECQDEKTGARFGTAKCRDGWAFKLGGGGRNRGSVYAYQVWAVVKKNYRSEQTTIAKATE